MLLYSVLYSSISVSLDLRAINAKRSPYLPTRAVKSRQEAFLCIFQLKYYLLDPIHALFI